ncbi:hypothetical protein GM160_08095 [Guyparkeria halophila]|uniref:Uncharacterized protein n=1 Tax=Guyparkeria halophila TaxID=47960 RepID=A0A6I6CZK0_9GAMM|nr:hypothetical protein [Guyparkeria halophila]QGT78860.1 hypothetical protein GM160_08095 [Guyparkeria halophila]
MDKFSKKSVSSLVGADLTGQGCRFGLVIFDNGDYQKEIRLPWPPGLFLVADIVISSAARYHKERFRRRDY